MPQLLAMTAEEEHLFLARNGFFPMTNLSVTNTPGRKPSEIQLASADERGRWGFKRHIFTVTTMKGEVWARYCESEDPRRNPDLKEVLTRFCPYGRGAEVTGADGELGTITSFLRNLRQILPPSDETTRRHESGGNAD